MIGKIAIYLLAIFALAATCVLLVRMLNGGHSPSNSWVIWSVSFVAGFLAVEVWRHRQKAT
jgi:hypothetical protein